MKDTTDLSLIDQLDELVAFEPNAALLRSVSGVDANAPLPG